MKAMIERFKCFDCNNESPVSACSVCNKETKMIRIFPTDEDKKRYSDIPMK